MVEHVSKGKESLMASKWGMVVDTRRCIGCQACTVACKAENKVPLGSFRTHVKVYESGTYPKAKKRFAPMLCMHCEKPPCVKVCPVEATYKREDGIVLINYEKCIGCGYCLDACPYDARYLNTEAVDEQNGGVVEWGGKRNYGKADKCTFCAHRLEKGLVPACVNTCVGGARQFGDFNDSSSSVHKIKQEVVAGSNGLNIEANYGPMQLGGLSVLYLLPAKVQDYKLPDLGVFGSDTFGAKQLVKVVGAVATAATLGYFGLSYISSSLAGGENG